MAATNQSARHAEISRRYSWAAKQRKNGDRAKKPDHSRLITLVRLRELERIFQSRYGRFLPDDDSGRDDLNLVADHIAHLGGDVVAHVLGWARAWAPWLPAADARELASRVAQDPAKFTADVLAWRLGLSAAERGALKITTIGAVGVSASDRLEERKLKDRERKRAKRAATSSSRPVGRPRKMRPQQVETIAADAFSDRIDDLSTTPETTATEREVTKPPADASGTPFAPQIVGLVGAEGVALVGNSSRHRRSFKTRFPTAMRLDEGMVFYAREAAFDPQGVKDMFETFCNWNVAMGAYSFDWREAWFAWVDRQVEYDTEQHHRERRRKYFEQRASTR